MISPSPHLPVSPSRRNLPRPLCVNPRGTKIGAKFPPKYRRVQDEIKAFTRRTSPGNDTPYRGHDFSAALVHSLRRVPDLSFPNFCNVHTRRWTRARSLAHLELSVQPQRCDERQWSNPYVAGRIHLASLRLERRLSWLDDLRCTAARTDSQIGFRTLGATRQRNLYFHAHYDLRFDQTDLLI